MFERSPFKHCPKCGREQALGILWISSDSYRRRCKFCRFVATYFLPLLDKKVLYLDQFAISEIFKVKNGMRRPDAPSAEFWTEASDLLNQAIMRQQIICPASNIHHDETIVFGEGSALGLAHEMMGGDTSFEHTTTIEHQQIYRHLEAYLKGEDPPSFEFGVDQILCGERNAWLPDLHITVETDWSSFVENCRLERDKAAENFAPLYDHWSKVKPTFEEALKNELDALGRGYVEAYSHFMRMAQAGDESGDDQLFIKGALSPVITLIHGIKREFVKHGVPQESALRETASFLSWPKNRSLPQHWISAHLYAAVANRFANGRRKHPSRGMMNDVKAISLYGPYVDAMLLDNECASLVKEIVTRGVELKAKIFCLNRSDDFLAYLRELIDSTPQEVIKATHELYCSA
jgi:hypothetical protein